MRSFARLFWFIVLFLIFSGALMMQAVNQAQTIRRLREENDNLRQHITQLQAAIDVAVAARAEALHQLDMTLGHAASLEEEIVTLQNAINSLTQELTDAQNATDALYAQLNAATVVNMQLRSELDNAIAVADTGSCGNLINTRIGGVQSGAERSALTTLSRRALGRLIGPFLLAIALIGTLMYTVLTGGAGREGQARR